MLMFLLNNFKGNITTTYADIESMLPVIPILFNNKHSSLENLYTELDFTEHNKFDFEYLMHSLFSKDNVILINERNSIKTSEYRFSNKTFNAVDCIEHYKKCFYDTNILYMLQAIDIVKSFNHFNLSFNYLKVSLSDKVNVNFYNSIQRKYFIDNLLVNL